MGRLSEYSDDELKAMGFQRGQAATVVPEGGDAYDQGYEAFEADLDRLANPHGERTQEHEEWNRGWDTAENE